MNFGERLHMLIQLENISQTSLSDQLHISPSTLNGYVRNKRQPEYQMLIRLAAYFGTTTDYLLGITEERFAKGSPLAPGESLLLDTYRLLDKSGQEFLVEQAKLIWRYQKKYPADSPSGK